MKLFQNRLLSLPTYDPVKVCRIHRQGVTYSRPDFLYQEKVSPVISRHNWAFFFPFIKNTLEDTLGQTAFACTTLWNVYCFKCYNEDDEYCDYFYYGSSKSLVLLIAQSQSNSKKSYAIEERKGKWRNKKSVYYSTGKTYVRKNEDGPPFRVFSEDDLNIKYNTNKIIK